MPEQRTVKPGDCIDSLAFEAGMKPEKIWNAPENEELRRRRDGPNVLAPGDVVTIPDREARLEPADTEKRHRFRSMNWRVKLRLRFLDQGEARGGVDYTLVVDEVNYTGKTDAEGVLEEMIPAGATRAVVRLGESGEDYALHIGDLDPLADLTGAQARLNSLGFGPLRVTGQVDGATVKALREFQASKEIPVTGELDGATRDALESAYGS